MTLPMQWELSADIRLIQVKSIRRKSNGSSDTLVNYEVGLCFFRSSQNLMGYCDSDFGGDQDSSRTAD